MSTVIRSAPGADTDTRLAADSQHAGAIARSILAQLQSRQKFFAGATFEDPQWLMMLDLFIAGEEGRDVSVSSLCLASGVPPTTALRHIRTLVSKGLFERTSHPRDKRICHVRLSDATKERMQIYLSSLAAGRLDGDEGPPLRAAH